MTGRFEMVETNSRESHVKKDEVSFAHCTPLTNALATALISVGMEIGGTSAS